MTVTLTDTHGLQLARVAKLLDGDWTLTIGGPQYAPQHHLVRADGLAIRVIPEKERYTISGVGKFEWNPVYIDAPNGITVSQKKTDEQIAKAINSKFVPVWESYWRQMNKALNDKIDREIARRNLVVDLAKKYPNCVQARGLDGGQPYVSLNMGKKYKSLELDPSGDDWYIRSGSHYITGDAFAVIAEMAEKKIAADPDCV